MTSANLTARGAATRSRIVEAAADLLLAHGVGGTSLDDIRERTGTSKSQLFHYFPGGKSELVGAIAGFQSGRFVDAQRPWLDRLDTWADWDGWRDAVLAHYAGQPHFGCPIGAVAAEVAGNDEKLAAELHGHMERWRGYLLAGLVRMRDNGLLRAEADPEQLSLVLLAALQGGKLLSQSMRSHAPLEAALDGALAALRSWSVVA
ncbi:MULTISPECIES: TetR/AcrR family transcriptional regulator [unclassified Crossiella]|uniref:TetR/AcrR family transcriptional regulator n=1 Tax=unclassified Crossiella TaxID=2620835 RepID=UPI001FFF41C0|nr:MULTISPECIES: TetR/AcrR family transcriptional regulator [unclassified Crossiella]MCK2237371.1 TetR/AcrR family transcriptional regulator [Crossiella sp. S99.2]MCK2251026.1 TetR/AcrR family transcriptional regulator [Crossiella sp. S99.1]